MSFHQSTMLAAWVHCLTKADTRGPRGIEMRVHSRRARFDFWGVTMVNRLRYLLGEIPEPTSYTDYFEVEALGDTYIVPLSTAHVIERELEKSTVTDWLEFRDVFGARHRLPARCVYRITESTRETRAALRELPKALHDEADEQQND